MDETLEYIGTALSSLCKKYPTAKFLIARDFNWLPVEDIFTQLDITNVVNFNTREQGRAVKFNQPENKMSCAQREEFFCSGVGQKSSGVG